MSAGIGWIDFSQADRERVSSVLELLKEQGMVDELGIGVLRDTLSDKLFPGLSTVQTRAKYFLLTPWLICQYHQKRPHEPLDAFFSSQEVKALNRLNKNKENEGESSGLFGITLRDASQLQRKPSSVYWSGQRLHHLIPKPEARSLRDYLQLHNVNYEQGINAKHQNEADDRFAGMEYAGEDNLLREPILRNMDFDSIDLSAAEATFLHQRLLTSCQLHFPDSLMLVLFEDSALREQALGVSDYAEFYLGLKGQILPPETWHLLTLAYQFSELMYGAHLRYNQLIREKIEQDNDAPSLVSTQREVEWQQWRTQAKPLAEAMDFTALFGLIPVSSQLSRRRDHFSRRFIENWVQALREQASDSQLSQLVITQEIKNKRERARLGPQPLSGKNQPEWIGMKRQNYRLKQAKILFKDIFSALESAAHG